MDRIRYKATRPEAYRAVLSLEKYVRESGLEHGLLDMVCLRVSQMNGCAFCVDMHDKDLRASGERPERIAMLPVFREAPSFTPRERAALAFAEALTTMGVGGVPDDVYSAALAEFGETALPDLALAIATINTWNRMNVAFRTPAGGYAPRPR